MGLGVERNLSSMRLSNGLKTICLHCFFYTYLRNVFFSTGHWTTYNWLTGSSMDTLPEYTLGSESVSSLLVFDKRRIRARKAVGEAFGTKHTGTSDKGIGHTNG